LSTCQIIEGTGRTAYQRALAVRNNIAADVLACHLDVTNQGVDLLNAIAAKIPA
jgi:hypothetical protein